MLSDRIGILDERLSFTLAARQIQIKPENFSATPGAVTSTYDKSAVVPGFGVLGKPWHKVSVYANYVEALEQGGIATAPALNAGAVFPALKSKQTEAGVKIDHGRFATTFALFRIEKGNQYRDTLSNLYVQDGRQENKAFEVSVFGVTRERRADLRRPDLARRDAQANLGRRLRRQDGPRRPGLHRQPQRRMGRSRRAPRDANQLLRAVKASFLD